MLQVPISGAFTHNVMRIMATPGQGAHQHHRSLRIFECAQNMYMSYVNQSLRCVIDGEHILS